MNLTASTSENIMLSVSEMEKFSDLTFVMAYENDIKPTPLDKPIVAFSTKGCEIGPKLTKTLETGEIKVTKERDLKITVSIDIYLPYSMGGVSGHMIFDRIATFLLYEKNYDIIKVVCNETDYDTSCGAIVLKSQFIFHAVSDV